MPLCSAMAQILDEALKEEFQKEEDHKEGVGQHFNETAASDEVRPAAWQLDGWAMGCQSSAEHCYGRAGRACGA